MAEDKDKCGEKRNFACQKDLEAKSYKSGQCVPIKTENHTIFYLVTKEFQSYKPLYSTIEKSLIELEKTCSEMEIREMIVPKSDFEMDELEWQIIERIIDDVFNESNVKIWIKDTIENKICSLTEKSEPIRGLAIFNNSIVQYLCDSGADVSLINQHLYENIKEFELETKLEPYHSLT